MSTEFGTRKLPPDMPMRRVFIKMPSGEERVFEAHAVVIHNHTRVLEVVQTIAGTSFAIESFAEGTYSGHRMEPYTREDIEEVFRISEQQDEVGFENQLRRERIAMARQERLYQQQAEHKQRVMAIAQQAEPQDPLDAEFEAEPEPVQEKPRRAPKKPKKGDPSIN